MSKIKLFEKKQIRTIWNETEEKWYFEVEDVVAVFTDSNGPKQYIKRLRQRDKELTKGWVQYIPTLLVILLLVIVGCKGSEQSNDDFITVDVTKSYKSKIELILQDFMDVEYIQLETNDEFVNQGFVWTIGKNHILVTNRNVFVSGDIFVYDRTGKALQKFNRKGQGKEEYLLCFGLMLDEENNEIYVHSLPEKKIQVYDLFGNYKRSLQYKENNNGMSFSEIFIYDKDNLICYDKFNKKGGFFLISKEDGRITQKIEIPTKDTEMHRVIDRGEGVQVTVGPDNVRGIYQNNGKWVLSEVLSDTVYNLLPDYSLLPYILKTPSIQSMNPEVLLVLRLLSDRYIFFETVTNEFNYNSETGYPKKFLMYDIQKKDFFGYTIYNGDYSTKKEIFLSVLRPVNHEIESWQPLESYQLVEALEKGELKGRLKEIAAGLDAEDNPVIMLVKHK